MTNLSQIVWEYLTATGTTLRTLVGGNVWSPRAPASWANDSAAVMFDIISETAPVSGGGHVTAQVQFSCYGGGTTHAAADAVYRALHDRLHGVRGAVTASGKLIGAWQTSGQPGDREIETEWPLATAVYTITTGA